MFIIYLLVELLSYWFSATYITKMTVRLADAHFREALRDTHSEDFKQLASSLKTPVSGIQTVFNPFTATRTTPSLKPNQPNQQSQKLKSLKPVFLLCNSINFERIVIKMYRSESRFDIGPDNCKHVRRHFSAWKFDRLGQ